MGGGIGPGLVVEIVVGVEERIAELVECSAMELVGSRLGDELDLRRALPGAVRAAAEVVSVTSSSESTEA